MQVRLIVTSLHQIKGFCRETHPLSRKQMCHEDTSSVSQTFKSNHAHTQRTQNEQNQWKSNQSLLHVPESRINIQGQNGVPLQLIWGEFQALTHCEFMSEITKQNTPAIPVRGTCRKSSPTLSDFGQHSFTIHSNNTRVAEHGVMTDVGGYW